MASIMFTSTVSGESVAVRESIYFINFDFGVFYILSTTWLSEKRTGVLCLFVTQVIGIINCEPNHAQNMLLKPFHRKFGLSSFLTQPQFVIFYKPSWIVGISQLVKEVSSSRKSFSVQLKITSLNASCIVIIDMYKVDIFHTKCFSFSMGFVFSFLKELFYKLSCLLV